MKKAVLWIVALVLAVALFAGAYVLYQYLSENYTPDNLGGTSENLAPDFTVRDWKGKKVQLSDYRGTPVVINFWATWCGFCVEEMPDFNTVAAEHPEVQFMMINVTDGSQETVESAKAFIEKNGYTFPVFFDTMLEAAMAYNATGLPCTFFISAEGELVAYARGMLTADRLLEGISRITE